MPRRNAVSPPQLPRDAPVVDVVHPIQINSAVIFRDNGDLARLDRRGSAVRHRPDLDEPLRGKPRLNDSAAAIALTECQRMIFFAYKKIPCRQIGQNSLASFVPI